MSLPEPGPLRFRPLLRRYVWGGRRLGTLLRKPTGEEPCAESWEFCDRGADQTRLAPGFLAGQTLGNLVQENGRWLLGRHHPRPRFPLLLKFLDAASRLSLQVHPDDARAARLVPPDCGKTEAWYVLEADPGSVIFAGLKPTFDRAALARRLDEGNVESCLARFEPRPGDCYFLPSGMVHALGGGLLIAELQQPSDVTYRLWDWGRLGPDGQPRPLHVAAGLEAIDDTLGPASVRGATNGAADSSQASSNRTTLIRCPQFVWDRWTVGQPAELVVDDRCHLLAVVQGAVELPEFPRVGRLERGDTLLVPAALSRMSLVPAAASDSAVVLDAYLP